MVPCEIARRLNFLENNMNKEEPPPADKNTVCKQPPSADQEKLQDKGKIISGFLSEVHAFHKNNPNWCGHLKDPDEKSIRLQMTYAMTASEPSELPPGVASQYLLDIKPAKGERSGAILGSFLSAISKVTPDYTTEPEHNLIRGFAQVSGHRITFSLQVFCTGEKFQVELQRLRGDALAFNQFYGQVVQRVCSNPECQKLCQVINDPQHVMEHLKILKERDSRRYDGQSANKEMPPPPMSLGMTGFEDVSLNAGSAAMGSLFVMTAHPDARVQREGVRALAAASCNKSTCKMVASHMMLAQVGAESRIDQDQDHMAWSGVEDEFERGLCSHDAAICQYSATLMANVLETQYEEIGYRIMSSKSLVSKLFQQLKTDELIDVSMAETKRQVERVIYQLYKLCRSHPEVVY